MYNGSEKEKKRPLEREITAWLLVWYVVPVIPPQGCLVGSCCVVCVFPVWAVSTVRLWRSISSVNHQLIFKPGILGQLLLTWFPWRDFGRDYTIEGGSKYGSRSQFIKWAMDYGLAALRVLWRAFTLAKLVLWCMPLPWLFAHIATFKVHTHLQALSRSTDKSHWQYVQVDPIILAVITYTELISPTWRNQSQTPQWSRCGSSCPQGRCTTSQI